MNQIELEVARAEEQSTVNAGKEPVYSSFSDDPDFAELVEFFVDAIPERIELLRESYQKQDIEQLRTTAHQLKGAGGGYGFEELSTHAARLEQACKQNDSDAIADFLEILIGYMGRITA